MKRFLLIAFVITLVTVIIVNYYGGHNVAPEKIETVLFF